jgi:catechol 2,3-dioxygenase
MYSSTNTDSPPFFAPRRLGHVNLYIADLDRSMEFYTKVLGIEEVYRTPLAGGGFVTNGNTHHDIGFITADGPAGKPRNARPGTLNHLGFELETETALVESYRRATAAGHRFLRTMDHDIAHSVYGTDPDGNVYELYADVVADWRNQRTGTVTKAKPDWWPGATPPIADRLYHEDPPIARVPDALFHPERTTGALIVTRDVAASLAHYRAVVGLHLVSTGRHGDIAVLAGSTGVPCLTLVPATAARFAGYHHASLRVADTADLDRSVAAARAASVEIVSDLVVDGRRGVLVRDPDGCLTLFYADRGAPPDLGYLDADVALRIL